MSGELKESFVLTISISNININIVSQYTLHTVKIEVNRCISVDVHTSSFTVYRYFYGIPAFLRYVGLLV